MDYRDFLQTFIPLFVSIDAVGLVPIFLAVTSHMTAARRRRVSFEAVATAKAELVEARMNKDLETVVERTNASFEKTVREQTRWIATIVFSAIGLMIAFYGIALHFK